MFITGSVFKKSFIKATYLTCTIWYQSALFCLIKKNFFLLKMPAFKNFPMSSTIFPAYFIVSTEAVDTMDLARVHRRRSVVRDFTVTALVPTVFYLELLYLQVMFSLRKSCLGIFLASFWKPRWPPEQFFDFFSYFFLILLLWLCYRQNFSEEINCYKRLP